MEVESAVVGARGLRRQSIEVGGRGGGDSDGRSWMEAMRTRARGGGGGGRGGDRSSGLEAKAEVFFIGFTNGPVTIKFLAVTSCARGALSRVGFSLAR
uniref:Uncharacterized protein n=1 Tax=Oryza sativa subsp. japonica TaxID=39947 RepID=Q339J7_ORYSJ|nr:hypothetical protein LOC_Os10g20870 [Oryza sativa Japonica Group]